MPKLKRSNITKAALAKAVSEAQNSGRLVRLWDAAVPGLGARIQPATGSVSWFIRYAKDDGGALRDYTLRNTDAATIEAIREAARAELAKVVGGKDPLDNREEVRASKTLREAFPDWLDECEGKVKASTLKEYRRLWTKEIAPALGARRARDITSADVVELHAKITGKGKKGRPLLANRVASRLHTFFAWAEKRGYIPKGSNPVTDDLERNPEREKERYLKKDEVKRLLAAIETARAAGLPVAPELKQKKRGAPKSRGSRAEEMRARRAAKLGIPLGSLPAARAYKLSAPRPKRGKREEVAEVIRPASPVAVDALRLLLFTGWREQEVLSLRWDALDTEKDIAFLGDTKTGASARSLSAVAKEIIERQPKEKGAVYVFPGRKKGEHLKEIRHLWYAVRHAAGLAGTRLHDLRHTFASFMASDGTSLPLIGAALGHKDLKSTQRYAKAHQEAVREAQDRTARNMAALVSGAETPVTPISVRKSAKG